MIAICLESTEEYFHFHLLISTHVSKISVATQNNLPDIIMTNYLSISNFN